MFNFIRNMFAKSATTSDMTWNVPVFSSEYEYNSIDSPYLSPIVTGKQIGRAHV